MQTSVTAQKFIKKEKSIENQLEDILTKLQNATKIENEFILGVDSVDSIYSPVKDRGKPLSDSGVDLFKKNQGIVKLEKTKLENIHKKLNDENIKVALFGDVSAGKSQTINSIIGRKLFIPAYCHTTICFVRISLTNELETIQLPSGEETVCQSEEEMRMKIKDRANFNGQGKLKPNEVLKIKIKKKERDSIMRKNVTLIDCPGGNDTQDVTDMIENVVVEADIFLYILTQVIFEQQRTFFSQLLTKTSAPNIFVLVNKWDETDNDDPIDTDKAHESLKAEISAWLTEMDPDNKHLSEKRIFFISAKETLQEKTEPTGATVTDQQKKRLDDFIRFEKVFGEHLDDTKEIKVGKHIKEFDKMEKNIKQIKESCIDQIKKLRDKRIMDQQLIKEKLTKLENLKGYLCEDSVKKIEALDSTNHDKFSKEHLKLIEKEMGKFTDVLEAPAPSIFTLAVSSAWSWSKKALGYEDTKDIKLIIKGSLTESMIAHIEREVDIIKVPLQRECDYYTKYITDLPTIESGDHKAEDTCL